MEEVDIKGRVQNSSDTSSKHNKLERLHIDSAAHQQPPGHEQHQAAAASSSSVKSQPPSREKLVERIKELEQLVSKPAAKEKLAERIKEVEQLASQPLGKEKVAELINILEELVWHSGKCLEANEGDLLNAIEGVDIKGRDQKSAVSSHKYESAAHQRPHEQAEQEAVEASSSSVKSECPPKQKLSDRITTLQQLVSPFGKTDTASVLLEAVGYIKFLLEQVQALSSSYLKSTNIQTTDNGEENLNGEKPKPGLRSRGLCLVPLSCTIQVANDNASDYCIGGTES
ncbi:hypothetical protein KP509_32G036000 [Ceratopteris richardii]|uniref:BHLH domain-containing protein n=1 Tax=Ceratopteris richardii TaxID=49495 RepID=A0A8T2QT16_CERRI|nr:hypothetical protein KP509_32G036000 [Ceratopteris richardii]KAH7287068.1 hypothetical protein KP509_32G036000 [Ceratopteris richardii]